MKYGWRLRSTCISLLAWSVACGAWAQGTETTAEIRTSDVRIRLSAGAHAPRLVSLAGAGDGATVWSNGVEESMPSAVEMEGKTVSLSWVRGSSGESDARHVTYVYECSAPHLRATWKWEARARSGAIEHSIHVENLSGNEVWLPLIDSLRLSWNRVSSAKLQNFYVEKGADTPSAHGRHLDAVNDGYRWTGKSSTYAHPIEGEAREIIPAEIVFDATGTQAGWFAGIEFSGRTRISLERKGSQLQTVLGLNPDLGTYKTRLAAGGSFDTPTVFLGAFTGGPDGAGNQLRPWVREVLTNPEAWKDPKYPLMVNNSWGSGMQVDEALALRMIGQSKELGLEMFHIDAGWFRGVGDWYPDEKKFPHGLAYVADEAHRQGLRFGIWVDWTQAALDTQTGALNVRDPKVSGWLAADVAADWKPEEFKGQTIDIGVPAAHDYAAKEVKRLVEDYHLDMLEHDGYLLTEGCTRSDHPHAPAAQSTVHRQHDSGFDFYLGPNSTDVSYHSVRAYYDIYSQLRKDHPGLLLEICNDGGRMVDFGSASHGDYFSITDTYDPLSNRRAFFDSSYVLPAAMLESYVEKWSAPQTENFLYMLRSGMMGWTTIMLDTTTWSAEQHEAAKKAFDVYKRELRPLIRDAHLYHVSDRPDGIHWDGVEYWDPSRKKGVVYAFRGSVADESEHRFVLAGLKAGMRYKLHFEDGSATDREALGGELMGPGLTVMLKNALSSELVLIEEDAKL
jgi:hypothetical protein